MEWKYNEKLDYSSRMFSFISGSRGRVYFDETVFDESSKQNLGRIFTSSTRRFKRSYRLRNINTIK